MTGQLSAQVLEIIRKMQQNELTESVIYEKIAVFAKGEENRQTLLRLSREERAHYEIWKIREMVVHVVSESRFSVFLLF